MSIDAIKKKQVEEVRRLRPINRARIIQYVVISALFVTFVSYLPDKDASSRRADRGAAGISLREQVALSAEQSSDWLIGHGYQYELSVFESISGSLQSRLLLLDTDSLFFAPYCYIVDGLIRIVFFLIASSRFLLLCILWGIVSSARAFRPYLGDDLLGETGNGKLFYSGIRASLDDVTQTGAPAQLVTNLATLKRVTAETAKASKLAQFLSRHNALNDTNLELIAHLLAYAELPFFAPAGDETFPASEINLIDGTYQLLEDHFQHARFAAVSSCFEDAAGFIHPCLYAALLLSIQAGKAMGYLREGNTWVRRSSFINLNARSVIHSIPSYKEDFSYDERQALRQALVYAKRYSSFGPVRLPQDMHPATRLLRQIAEVVLAAPQQVQSVAAEVELYGRCMRAHEQFAEQFFKRIQNYDQQIMQHIVATESGLVCIDVQTVVTLCSSVIDDAATERLADLVSLVSQTQKVLDLQEEMREGELARGSLPTFQRIFLPIPFPRLKKLAAEFSVHQDVMLRWSIYRNMFHSFGWIARQVGTTMVPDESCTYVVFRGAQWSSEANQLGLLGKTGMVSFRSTAFEQHLGKNWRSRFSIAESAAIAEDRPYFEKLLTGYDPLQSEDEEGTRGA